MLLEPTKPYRKKSFEVLVFKDQYDSWVQWYTTVTPATVKADAGGSQVQGETSTT